MTKTYKDILIIGSIIVLVFAGYMIFKPVPQEDPLGGGDGFQARSCTISTVANAIIGTTSSTVLAAHSGRAWARITQVQNTAAIATSTPFLSFNAGASAVANSGVTLGTTTPSIDFGRNTDFPYTGAVTAINANILSIVSGSTTVQVTECRY